MKKAKKLWMAAALAVGLGLGFGVAFSPAPAHAGKVECTRHSDCDAKCGGPGTGACHAWKCYCVM